MARETEVLELEVPLGESLATRRKRGVVSTVVFKPHARMRALGSSTKALGDRFFLVPGAQSDPAGAAEVLEAAIKLTRKVGPAEVMKLLTATAHVRRSPPARPVIERADISPTQDTAAGEAERWPALRCGFLAQYKSVTAPKLAHFTGSKAKNQSARAHDWVKAGRIFSVNDGAAELYPLFQLREGQPIPVLDDILKVLTPALSSWQVAFWLTTPNAWTGSWRAPVDILTSEPGKALEAARHEVADKVF